jgi:hypothetical protein
MHVYRNRRYEEEIVMLMWHKKGEQRMVEVELANRKHRYRHITRSQKAQHKYTVTVTVTVNTAF